MSADIGSKPPSRALAVIAVGVVALLIGGLFLLLPEDAAASSVGATSIGNMSRPDAAQAPNVFEYTMTFQITVPAGERIPIDSVDVLMAKQGTGSSGPTISNGLIASSNTNYCAATKAGGGTVTSAKAVIVGTPSGPKSTGNYFGYGATDLQFQGGSFTLTGQGDLGLTGTGSGFGQAGASSKVSVTVKITGCAFRAIFDAAPATSPEEAKMWVQPVVVLQSGGPKLIGAPVKHTFYDPAFKPTGTSTTADTSLVATKTTIGTSTSTKLVITQTDGKALLGGQTVETTTGETTGVTKVALQVKTTIADADQPLDSSDNKINALPAGSDLDLIVDDSTLGSPAFGQNAGVLAQETDEEPFVTFQAKMSIPGMGDVDPNDYIECVDLTLSYAKSRFGTTAAAQDAKAAKFKMVAFDDAGLKKAAENQPSRTDLEVVGANYVFTFKVCHFSSFAVLVGKTTIPSGDYDITSSLTVTREGGANALSWTAKSGAAGYQIWRSTGAGVWTLAKTVEGGTTTEHTDNAASFSARYKLTYYTGDSVLQGKSSDADSVGGFDKTVFTSADPTQVSTGDTSSGGGFAWQWWLVIGFFASAMILLVVLVVVRAGGRGAGYDDYDDADEYADADQE